MQLGLPGLFGVPATALAVGQWSHCSVAGGFSVGDPAGPWPDFCGYAQRVLNPPLDVPTLMVRWRRLRYGLRQLCPAVQYALTVFEAIRHCACDA